MPKEVIRRQGSETGVFILDGTKLVWRPVRTGITSVTRVQILEGLQEGDQVALPVERAIKAGDEVKPVFRKGNGSASSAEMKFAIIATLAVVASAQDHPVRRLPRYRARSRSFTTRFRGLMRRSLGALICKYDPVIGSGILRGAIDDLNSIPADAFKETSTLLRHQAFQRSLA